MSLASSRSDKSSVKSRFDGWAAGGVVIFMAGISLALLGPWSVEPRDVPAPAIDVAELERSRRLDEAEAAAAERDSLDVDVRELGSAYRAYGRAEAADDTPMASAARQRISAVAGAALRVGPDAVRRLRAYQLRSFLRELRRWEATGDESDELRELGGGFVRVLRRHRWVEEIDGRRRVLLDGAALRALFKLRWNEATGLSQPGPGGTASAPSGLEVSLDERRALIRFSIGHPIPAPGAELPDGRRGVPAKRSFEDQYTLRKIDELAKIDPAYPADLARGVVLYRLRRYALSTEAFRRHLERFPDGPSTLRARNYLRAAMAKAREEL